MFKMNLWIVLFFSVVLSCKSKNSADVKNENSEDVKDEVQKNKVETIKKVEYAIKYINKTNIKNKDQKSKVAVSPEGCIINYVYSQEGQCDPSWNCPPDFKPQKILLAVCSNKNINPEECEQVKVQTDIPGLEDSPRKEYVAFVDKGCVNHVDHRSQVHFADSNILLFIIVILLVVIVLLVAHNCFLRQHSRSGSRKGQLDCISLRTTAQTENDF